MNEGFLVSHSFKIPLIKLINNCKLSKISDLLGCNHTVGNVFTMMYVLFIASLIEQT